MANQQSEKDDNDTQMQSSERNFSENELGDLMNALNPVAYKAKILGIQLGIMAPKMKAITEEFRSSLDQLFEILLQRFGQGPFSLQSLLKALRCSSVDKKKLALEIETQFQYSQSESVTLQTSPANTANPVTASATAPPYPQHVTQLSNTANATVMTQSDITRAPYCADQLPLPQQYVRAQNPYIPYQPPFHYHQSQTGNQLPFHYVPLAPAPFYIGTQQQAFSPSHFNEHISNSRSRSVAQQDQSELAHLHQPLPLEPAYISPIVLSKSKSSQQIESNQTPKHTEPRFIQNSIPSSTSLTTVCEETIQSVGEQKSVIGSSLPALSNTTAASENSLTMSQFGKQPLSAVVEFTDYIKEVYRSSEVEKNPEVIKWPPTPSKVFINLVCIDRKTVSPKQADEITQKMVEYGDVDAILRKKTPIEFSSIAQGMPVSQPLIIIEGAPGVGKSTFAWEYCRKWERGEIAQQYKLVLLFRLRDEMITKATSFSDLLNCIYNDSEICDAVQREMKSDHGASILILLEGFDELPKDCRSQSSLFMKIIHGKLPEIHNATVLVTSRPWATHDLHRKCSHRIFQHLEILGFRDEQIEEYIKSIYSDENGFISESARKSLKGLMEYIRTYPQIRACMYIPLNAAIVVSVYQECQRDSCILPKTLTELYFALLQTILLRYLHGHQNYSEQTWQIQSLERDLPKSVYQKLLEISRLAYEGICTKQGKSVKLIYTDLPPCFDSLGLMQSVYQLYVSRGEQVSHNFLHLTVQEFLTAFYISTLSPPEQLEHFQRKDGRMNVVLIFVSGITKLANHSVNALQNLLLKKVDKIFREVGEEKNSMFHIERADVILTTKCIRWIFESQNDHIFSAVMGEKIIELVVKKLTRLEYYSMGYCISNSQSQWMLRIHHGVTEDDIMMLADGANTGHRQGTVIGLTGPVKMGVPDFLDISGTAFHAFLTNFQANLYLKELFLHLQPSILRDISRDSFCSGICDLEILYLKFSSKDEPSSKLDYLLENVNSLALGYLVMQNGVLNETTVQIITSFSQLCYLRLDFFTFSCSDLYTLRNRPKLCVEISNCKFRLKNDDDVTMFASMAAKNSNLFKKLDLTCLGSSISDTGIAALTLSLDHDYVINMYGEMILLPFSASFVALLANIISQNTTVECLSISFEESTSDAAAAHLAKELYHNSSLIKLKLLSSCISDTGAISLAEALCHNTTLQELDLTDNYISDKGVASLADTLLHNNTLENINLSQNKVSEIGAASIAKALHQNTTLQRLNLSYNNICNSGAISLAEALCHNTTLQELDLTDNYISDKGVASLADTLLHNNTLENINLSQNKVSEIGAASIAKVLHQNTTLQRLNLSFNNICNSGAISFAEALRHNTTLQQPSLCASQISTSGATSIAQVLHHNTTLQRLNLSSNHIGYEGVASLAEALHHNSTLQDLNLSNNDIHDNSTLNRLDLFHNSGTFSQLNFPKDRVRL